MKVPGVRNGEGTKEFRSNLMCVVNGPSDQASGERAKSRFCSPVRFLFKATSKHKTTGRLIIEEYHRFCTFFEERF